MLYCPGLSEVFVERESFYDLEFAYKVVGSEKVRDAPKFYRARCNKMP
jgi:hypothetical protein